MVPENGVEPSRSCDHWILSPARLPVPPLGHGGQNNTTACCASNFVFRKSIQQHWPNIKVDVMNELLICPEDFLAGTAAGLSNTLGIVSESREIVTLNLVLNFT